MYANKSLFNLVFGGQLFLLYVKKLSLKTKCVSYKGSLEITLYTIIIAFLLIYTPYRHQKVAIVSYQPWL